ncbi:MAG: hypothetical protein P4M14_02395 [Gammaproteobacteria bacterium]|nr:hypothetical protein [Gammaproteobacteria bacterium]
MDSRNNDNNRGAQKVIEEPASPVAESELSDHDDFVYANPLSDQAQSSEDEEFVHLENRGATASPVSSVARLKRRTPSVNALCTTPTRLEEAKRNAHFISIAQAAESKSEQQKGQGDAIASLTTQPLTPASSATGAVSPKSASESPGIEIVIDSMVAPRDVPVVASEGFSASHLSLPAQDLRQRVLNDGVNVRRFGVDGADKKSSEQVGETKRSGLWCICDCFKRVSLFGSSKAKGEKSSTSELELPQNLDSFQPDSVRSTPPSSRM